MKPPPEFQLVAACCRWPVADEAVRAAAEGVDWPLVARVAERHRVEGLVWNALRQVGLPVPEEVAARLRSAAAAIGRQNLVLAAESVRLDRMLAAAGISPLFVKGITLGALAYGSIAPKMGWDIDLLVPLAAVEESAALLERAGYRLLLPEGPNARSRLALWHRHWKESVWIRADATIHVELHTRLSDNPLLLPGVGSDSPVERVEVSRGMSLATLRRDELFAYLCVHGASSAWFRLKWIADVNALIAPSDPAEIDRLYRRSQQLGAGRSAAQALLLCAALFDLRLPPALAAELRSDRWNRWLLAIALRKLAGRSVVTELHDARLGTATIHLMQFALLPGLRFKLAELGLQLISPADRIAVSLPRGLGFLYPLVSLARRATRRAG
ncbi:MAG: nucleotidyltransferase family protein [Allosphingosinicella sp.]